MVGELCSGPCLAMEIRAHDAAVTFREFVGPADPVSHRTPFGSPFFGVGGGVQKIKLQRFPLSVVDSVNNKTTKENGGIMARPQSKIYSAISLCHVNP